jgi:hypothetical protein
MNYWKRNRVYKSGFEDRAKKMFEDNGIDAEYEQDKIAYVIPKNYVPDFKIGSIYIETKGYFDAEAVKKMKHVKECNPELDIRMWFQKDGKVPGRKKMKYSDWCEKYGYPYHIGESFPSHWFTEEESK